jgi:hypothetical protein
MNALMILLLLLQKDWRVSMTKREFICQFVIAHVRTGQSALYSTNMGMVVEAAETRWNEIVKITPED